MYRLNDLEYLNRNRCQGRIPILQRHVDALKWVQVARLSPISICIREYGVRIREIRGTAIQID
jgi:hypothetical protein